MNDCPVPTIQELENPNLYYKLFIPYGAYAPLSKSGLIRSSEIIGEFEPIPNYHVYNLKLSGTKPNELTDEEWQKFQKTIDIIDNYGSNACIYVVNKDTQRIFIIAKHMFLYNSNTSLYPLIWFKNVIRCGISSSNVGLDLFEVSPVGKYQIYISIKDNPIRAKQRVYSTKVTAKLPSELQRKIGEYLGGSKRRKRKTRGQKTRGGKLLGTGTYGKVYGYPRPLCQNESIADILSKNEVGKLYKSATHAKSEYEVLDRLKSGGMSDADIEKLREYAILPEKTCVIDEAAMKLGMDNSTYNYNWMLDEHEIPDREILNKENPTVGKYTHMNVYQKGTEDGFTAINHIHTFEDLKDFVEALSGVLQGIAFLQTRGFMHGDIKSQNIVRISDEFKLIDMGEAVLMREMSRHRMYVMCCNLMYYVYPSTNFLLPLVMDERYARYYNSGEKLIGLIQNELIDSWGGIQNISTNNNAGYFKTIVSNLLNAIKFGNKYQGIFFKKFIEMNKIFISQKVFNFTDYETKTFSDDRFDIMCSAILNRDENIVKQMNEYYKIVLAFSTVPNTVRASASTPSALANGSTTEKSPQVPNTVRASASTPLANANGSTTEKSPQVTDTEKSPSINTAELQIDLLKRNDIYGFGVIILEALNTLSRYNNNYTYSQLEYIFRLFVLVYNCCIQYTKCRDINQIVKMYNEVIRIPVFVRPSSAVASKTAGIKRTQTEASIKSNNSS